MALVPCPECGTQISTDAIACPKCGRRARKPVSVFRIVALLVVAVVVVYSYLAIRDYERKAGRGALPLNSTYRLV